ncbi:Extracellular signal-regulated kinase 1 [Phytophthora cinnamomi]|uniref:Extracellular signal-regulated kinase 1 n=1 Tax=Phytophthora cinnamomi TaxID=4785 RepID=UPI00355A487E|nr:Extracellular signal-regulated kinase 1 [Phytophthora cinnamomi]
MARRELNVRELLELERQIYQESIDRVLQQQRQLRAGELDEFVRRCAPFEADRERELRVARAQFQFSCSDALTLRGFDLQQAEDVFRSERLQLKRKLLERVRRRRLRVEKRLRALDDPSSNSKPRAKAKVAAVAGALEGQLQPQLLETQLRRAQRRTRKSFNFRHFSGGVLPSPQRIVEDVVGECQKLQRNRELQEVASMAEEEGAATRVQVAVSADGQKLVCRGGDGREETFAVGDAVVLTSKLTEEDFHGFVSAVTPEEVKLVLVCGSHARVTLSRLRSGQCTLETQQPLAIAKPEEGQENIYANGSVPGATTLDELIRDPPDARRRATVVMNRLKRKTTIDIRRGF